MFLWVVYDISDNKIRKIVSMICRDYGLSRLQKSVFFGTLGTNRINELKTSLKDVEEDIEDSIYNLPVCESCIRKKHVIGKDFNEDEFLPRKFFIYN